MMANIKEFYKHVHFHENGIRMPAVSFYIQHNKDTDKMRISWAICSPADNFSRAVGRSVAENNEKHGIYVEGQRDYTLPMEMNILLIMEKEDIFISTAKTEHYRKQAMDTCEQIYLMEAITIAYNEIRENRVSHNEVYNDVEHSNFLQNIINNIPYYSSRFF